MLDVSKVRWEEEHNNKTGFTTKDFISAIHAIY